ncbi:Cobalt-zinc-cadmium resistance protein CzcA [Burkholderia cepacia]|nr:Cobalt-zinc-cadmium resistance protein CzcA [Burkholderia cepacia]
MFERLIRFAIAHRWLVMLAIAAVAALGVFSYQKLPIDAVPDITNVQVQINTAAPGYSPLEAEQRITYPVETVMAGLPGLEQTRSISRYGLSQVTVIFKDGTDIYFARQLVNERIQEAKDKLRPASRPRWGRRRRGSARSTCGPSKPMPPRASPTARVIRRPTCANCRTGSCGRSSGTCAA